MRDLDATAFDSRDCRFPGCPYEATNTDGMCRDHHGRIPAAPGSIAETHNAQGRLIPGSLANLMEDDEDEPKESTVTDLVMCRIDGCSRASVAQTGPWKGWCAEHKHLRGKKPDAVKPPPGGGTAEVDTSHAESAELACRSRSRAPREWTRQPLPDSARCRGRGCRSRPRAGTRRPTGSTGTPTGRHRGGRLT